MKDMDKGTKPYDGIAVDETTEEVTIRITGKALANIREMQAVLNKLRETDETASDFVWDNILCEDWWEYLGSKRTPSIVQSLPGIITERLGGEEQEELEEAFKAAGFSCT